MADGGSDFLGSLASMQLADLYDSPPLADATVGTQAVSVAAMLRATRLLSVRVEAVLAPLGLTMARFEVLGRCHASIDGRVSFSELKRGALVHASTISHTINRLESAGHIRRRTAETDRRAQVAEITPKGSELAARAIEAMASVDFGLVELDGDALRQLCVILARIDG